MDSNDDEPLGNVDDVVNNEDVNHRLLTQQQQRWTCEACGCHTNQVGTDRNCTICGTSHTASSHHHFGTLFQSGGPSNLRRAIQLSAASSNVGSGHSTSAGGVGGGGLSANYSAAIRAGWLARSLNHHASRLATSTGTNHNDTSNGVNNNSMTVAQLAGMMDAAAAAGSSMNDDFSFDDDDLLESVMNGMADPTSTHLNGPSHPLEIQFALGMNNYNTARNRYVAESNRQQRLLQLEVASRTFSNAIREPLQSSTPPPTLRVAPDDLYRIATINSAMYHPSWADPGATNNPTSSTRSSRSAAAAGGATNRRSDIDFSGSGLEWNQIAHVMFGATEGRAIRAEQPFPRLDRASHTNVFDPFHLSFALSPTNSNDSDSFDLLCNTEVATMQQPTQSRVFGFRVAFDNPALPVDDEGTRVGMDLGGCFLIGVTSSTFTSPTDSSTLLQSNTFWGIEDHGQIFAGNKRSDVSGGTMTAVRASLPRHQSRRRSYIRNQDGLQNSSTGLPAVASGSFSMDLGISEPMTSAVHNTEEIEMNSHSVVFGICDVVTVICDVDNRSLTFWRNETLLGTLVTNLPRSGSLYPVAVPFNTGTTVAITSLKGDPLQLLRHYSANWKIKLEEKNQKVMSKLAKERSVLIKDGIPTSKLQKVLYHIFAMYSGQGFPETTSNDVNMEHLKISVIMAARLWYRCGMKLSSLENILRSKEKRYVVFRDFYALIKKVIDEDERENKSMLGGSTVNIEIGDKVELVEGFERYGDASSGPLQVGDRGVVVDVQRGPNGELQSARVLHSGRRWWYHAQAIISEKSGLIESPVVWFLNGILRSHGFDHTTLVSFVAKSVSPQSWRVGDIVTHKSTSQSPTSNKSTTGPPTTSIMIGRIVADTSESLLATSAIAGSRQHSTVAVEFISRDFAEAVGVKVTNSSTPSVDIRRVKTSKLVHTTEIHGCNFRFPPPSQDAEDAHVNTLIANEPEGFFDSIKLFSTSVNEKVLLDIEAMRCLDRAAMEALTRQCKKSSNTLASMFAAGLPDAIMEAITAIERQMNSLEPKDDLPDNLSALGSIVIALTEQLYGSSSQLHEQRDMEIDASDTQSGIHWQNAPRNVQNREQVRPNFKNSGQVDSLREDDGRGDPLLLASLQQRQNMLVSLMSRASRPNGNVAPDVSEAVFEPFGQIPRTFTQPHSSSPFRYAGSNDLLDYEESVQEHTRNFVESSLNLENEGISSDHKNSLDIGEETLSTCAKRYLDSLLRCYGSVSSKPPSGTTKQGSAAFAVFTRHLIRCGVLFNSTQWAEALIAGHSRNYYTMSPLKASSMLRGVVDDEGTPILILAIKLGCSVDLLIHLIQHGASVGKDSLNIAATTNQPKALSLLLQHIAYEEGSIDLELCSPEIRRLLILTKSRQEELSKRMEDAAGGFMGQLLLKLMDLGLSSRQIHIAQIDKCSKSICEMLVGNVLLRALQGNQTATTLAEDGKHNDEQGQIDPSRMLVENEGCSLRLSQGLLGILPPSLFRDVLFHEVGNITKFFLLCEDYLCSKDMADVAAGLTMLSLTLSKFPQMKLSSEVERFGICEFVSNHKVLSSNRIADILSKELNIGLDVSASLSVSNDDARCTSVPSSFVLCPKKHKATLHITPHSSFQCDICTSAVPKGEYIFGCRQCDYDECLQCTLRDEKRTLCVQMTIRELASECYRILSGEGKAASHVTDLILNTDSSKEELKSLTLRLLQRDVHVMKDLGNFLTIPGRISIHEFLTIILPSLHASMVGSTANNDVYKGSIHKSKKARSSRGSPDDSLDARLHFCREALHRMNSHRTGAKCKSASTEVKIEINEKMKYSALVDKDNDDDDDNCEKLDLSYCTGFSELLRRLHQILTFYENVSVMAASDEKSKEQRSAGGNSDLHDLTKPMGLILLPLSYENSETSLNSQSVIYAEPLIPLTELQLHVVRAHRINDDAYISYCQCLVNDMAIIIERPRSQPSSSWKIAKIENYNAATGGHTVRYASSWKRGKERQIVHLDNFCEDISAFTFNSRATIILAAREYYIIRRTESNHLVPFTPVTTKDNDMNDSFSDSSSRLVQAIGSRVESSCTGESSWKVLTLSGIDVEASKASTDGMRFMLVSDDGEVFTRVPAEQIRARGVIVREESSRQGRSGRLSGEERNSLFPYLALRERMELARSTGERTTATSDVHNHTKALKRTWSALSLKDEMISVDLKVSTPSQLSGTDEDLNFVTMDCKLDETAFQFISPMPMLEQPPRICVHFSTHEKLPTMDLLRTPDTTLISALHQLHQKQKKWSECPPTPICRLFFSVELKFSNPSVIKFKQSQVAAVVSSTNVKHAEIRAFQDSGSRCRKICASLSVKEEESNSIGSTSLCDGIDEICVQCMEVIGLISECAKDPASPSDREILNLPGFANQSLSSKLSSQLNQSMFCVGSALPDWCLKAAAFAPHMFTYETRRMLLERTAFGPSRSALCQQETKVNVGKLRQRMASLRARAVELVGEAFAGGADDPTALQLQADELYGMEEALASRVKSAFRAAKWQEHALQVAKAAVRRDRLLLDAASIMDEYTNDRTVCRRRLEVRFEGESGFDAASGDEAGVTRGFYADVAEALLSLDIVAGAYCSSECLPPTAQMSEPVTTEQLLLGSQTGEVHKLPLWIPDIDSNMHVIIPTPRAAKGSCLGVFPRPIPKYHPQFDSVIKMFRLMGRLFAAALRDGFMFPVPISAAFLKLVQHGRSIRRDIDNGHAPLLASDLPRPGFLGGEVYAADFYICQSLDQLDTMDPPLSRHDLKRAYESISTDPSFARVALGKSYDCSFEEYFQDRTFVDPIDPAQDAEAAPLCHKGHTKSITIYNVREWVTLAKNFMLYDGVIEQAMAFRQGVNDFFSSDYLCVFTSDELQRDVLGVGDDVDNWNEASIRKLFKLDGGNGATEALVAVAAIGGEGGAALSRRFGPSSPTISFLIKALLDASSIQRRQFLNFVTSVPIASVKMGTIEVVPILSPSGEFLPMHDPSCLPRANTCSRRLYLPKFESYDTFSEVLWAVVREESKFKGFYEWRGS